MSVNLTKFFNLNVRIDFDAIGVAANQIDDSISGLGSSIWALFADAINVESETREESLAKAESVQNLLAASGLESSVNDLLANMAAVRAIVDELQSALDSNPDSTG